MAIQKQLAFGKLSERAQILIHQMLDCHESAAYIARTIYRTTQEKISPEAIARHAKIYSAKVQAKENARQRTSHLVGEIIHQGAEVSDMLRAAFLETFARARKTGALHEMNPLLFEAAERHRLELDLHKKQVSLAERRVKVFEKRWKLDPKKAQAAIDKLDRKARAGKSLTAEEMERIREIYGLSDTSERQRHSEDRKARQIETDDTDDNSGKNANRKQAGNEGARG